MRTLICSSKVGLLLRTGNSFLWMKKVAETNYFFRWMLCWCTFR